MDGLTLFIKFVIENIDNDEVSSFDFSIGSISFIHTNNFSSIDGMHKNDIYDILEYFEIKTRNNEASIQKDHPLLLKLIEMERV